MLFPEEITVAIWLALQIAARRMKSCQLAQLLLWKQVCRPAFSPIMIQFLLREILSIKAKTAVCWCRAQEV
ncbi:hypothetical protein BHU11_06730 [Tannerella sp. oral taxon 808]|nr:hypothetical protein BHU11_06730 [Tannerella sp. oral taxon 808]